MRTSAILLMAAIAGCSYHERWNPAAKCVAGEWSDLNGDHGQYFRGTGEIRILEGLDQRETAATAMHEFVHACEDHPRLSPREVLRLYESPSWQVLYQDLEPILIYLPPPKLITQ